jgi:hypothetical protein
MRIMVHDRYVVRREMHVKFDGVRSHFAGTVKGAESILQIRGAIPGSTVSNQLWFSKF